MKTSIKHANEMRLSNYRTHSLDNFCPMLKKYIREGMNVLDVGCGPGSVTANIAQIIGQEGTIVGIDQEAESLDEAGALCSQLGLTNVTFMKGDAYEIPFEADRFDLVFSSAVFEYLKDPVKALRQKLKVTKPGGIVAVRAGDFGTFTLYPSCPSVIKILHANLQSSLQSDDRYFNGYVGRELYDIFRQSDLEDIGIEAFVPPLSCNYPGSEYFAWRQERSEGWFSPERTQSSDFYQSGLVNDEDIESASKEMQRWLDHPAAFFMMTSVFATGRVV